MSPVAIKCMGLLCNSIPVFYHLVVSELIPYGQYTARVDLLVPCTDACPKPLNELLPPVPN